jgi:hypothetical protein
LSRSNAQRGKRPYPAEIKTTAAVSAAKILQGHSSTVLKNFTSESSFPEWVRGFIDRHREEMAALSIKEASKYL